MITFDNRYILI